MVLPFFGGGSEVRTLNRGGVGLGFGALGLGLGVRRLVSRAQCGGLGLRTLKKHKPVQIKYMMRSTATKFYMHTHAYMGYSLNS